MSDMDNHNLSLLAIKTLNIKSSASPPSLPKGYVDELKAHLTFYPNDTNFTVIPEPKRGYGQVVCLENGCGNVAIPLQLNGKLSDGGKKDGVGSLTSYRAHIVNHPTHQKQRHARVKAEASRKTNPASKNIVKAEPKAISLSKSSPASVSKPGLSVIKQEPSEPRRSSLVRLHSMGVKPEAIIPDKRSLVDSHDSPAGVSQIKKAKVESPKKRSALADSNSSDNVPGQLTVEQLRLSINTTQSAISSVQTMLDRVKAKKKKTKADLTRMRRYEGDLVRLRQQKANYTAQLPAASPQERTIPPKPELASLPVPPGYNMQHMNPNPAYNMQAVNHVPPMYSLHPMYNMQPPAPSAFNMQAGGPMPPMPGAFPNVQPKMERAIPPMPGAFPNVHAQPAQPKMERALPAAPSTSFNFPPVIKAPVASGSKSPAHAGLAAQPLNVIRPIAPVGGDLDNFDDQGNFFGRGRDTFQGPRAKADDIDHFLLVAGNAEQFDGNASVDKAIEKLGLHSIYDPLPNMTVALMPHQTIGVAWMLDKEQGPLKGGCLGDDMGLGKTVQMIALIVKNPPTDARKTTLIIAPTALMDQWKMEIELKTNEGLKCLIYHGSGKVRSKKELLKYDVVLTTYQTMALEWPDTESEMKKKAKKKKQGEDFIVSDSDDEAPKRDRKKERGLLFQVEFYRVVLDEAQCIRNKRTRVSRAATELDSTYRWCLTGTPIINSLGDVYPYLRFLRIRPWYDFSEFHQHIGSLEKKQPNVAVTKLQAILATFVLRRMKDSMLDGKKLIELPLKTIDLVKLNFMDEERDVYNLVERNSQATFNRFLRAGTVLKNYSQVLVLLLRLRQICSHPSLIQENGDAFVTVEEFEEHSKDAEGGTHPDLTRARRTLGPEFVARLKARFKETVLKRMAAEKESADATIDDEECPICFDAFTNPVVTHCGHVFCRECITDVINTPVPEGAATGDDAPKLRADERPCPSCRTAVCEKKLFARSAFEPSDEELNPPPVGDNDVQMADGTKLKKTNRKGKKKAPKRPRRESADIFLLKSDTDTDEEDDEEDDDLSDFIVQSDEDEEEKDARREMKKNTKRKKAFVVADSDSEIEDTPEDADIIFGKKKIQEKKKLSPEAIKLLPRFLPSTKMKWMMERIKTLAEEKPDEKAGTLVVSQWTSCLSLVSDYLEEFGIVHVKYQGDMNRPKRDHAVRAFMTNEKVQVMLMSLKCGGVGLNLIRANNVISLDLGWSQAVESQAFDRVHRLGQTRTVDVRRLVISNTVEDRILQLQLRKQDLADGSLGEGNAEKLGRLTVRQLANLFGLDHRGRRLEDLDAE